jgi:hypothetical protein
MNRFRITPFVLMLALVLSAAPLYAATAIQQMAEITMQLNHHTSDAEKTTLRGISDSASATAGERALAAALINMEHKVGAEDKQKLQELMKTDGASAEERTLAEVLIGINHKPSSADVKKLRQLAGQ